jgi:DNA-directed RNA polymerase specialized sigma24 family protein
MVTEQRGTHAFDDFYRDEYRRLVPVIAALLGDRAGAEDVVQEALVEAQRRWATVEVFDRPGALVRATCRTSSGAPWSSTTSVTCRWPMWPT